MRLGPFHLTRHRAARALAGLVAAFVFSGNVLAAAGLCAIKAPAEPRGSSVPVVAMADAAKAVDPADCAGHHANPTPPASSAHHCPTDDPSAQSRTVDVPAAQLMVAIAATFFSWSETTMRSAPLVVAEHPAEARPLYARLQRLHL